MYHALQVEGMASNIGLLSHDQPGDVMNVILSVSDPDT